MIGLLTESVNDADPGCRLLTGEDCLILTTRGSSLKVPLGQCNFGGTYPLPIHSFYLLVPDQSLSVDHVVLVVSAEEMTPDFGFPVW